MLTVLTAQGVNRVLTGCQQGVNSVLTSLNCTGCQQGVSRMLIGC